MEPIREIVERLIASGMEAVEAATLMAAALAAHVAPQRSAGALRTQRWRERHKASQTVTSDSVTEPSQSVTKRHSVTSPSLSIETKKEKRERGARLPDDWKPRPEDEAEAVKTLGKELAAAELLKFHDHWKQQPGQRGVKLDWTATYRNWMRRAAEYRQNKTQQTTVKWNGFEGVR